MKFNRKIAYTAVLLGLCTSSALAANSDTIKVELDQALANRETAHQLAENARLLGADESHYCIWYAKQMWNEHNDDVVRLTAEYNAAKQEENNKGVLLGNFRISYYCPCTTCNGNSHGITASGARLQPGVSIAVDPSVIPLGSKVYIEGLGWRVAHDTGSAIKGNRIDVCVSGHSEAYANGIDYLNVYKK